MRPSSLRRDREKQFSYMSQNEYEQQLKKQVEEKKMLQQQEKIQNQQEIINHYKNNQMGGAEGKAYMQDLNQLVNNKERELQMYQDSRSRQNAVSVPFQGDMNDFSKVHRTMTNPVVGDHMGAPHLITNQSFEKQQPGMRQGDIFSDDFLKNYRGGGAPIDPGYNGAPQQRNENLNIINGMFGNANPQNNLAIMPGAVAQSLAESERERRLKLRDMERMKRMEGFSGGDYGKVDTSTPAQFEQPQSTSNNRRDQVWQQKLAQRVSSQDNPYRPPQQIPSLQQQLPIYHNQQSGLMNAGQPLDMRPQITPPHSSEVQLRSSRIHAVLSDAIKLDQSLTQQDYQTQVNAQKPPLIQPGKAPSNPLFGGEDDLQKRRRETDKVQRQKEYQEYLAQQNRGIPISVTSGTPTSRQPVVATNSSNPLQSNSQHSSHSSHRVQQSESSSILQVAGGLNLLGMHQMKQQEDKARKQREYKEHLDQQNAVAASKKDDSMSIGARRKDISDQVFNEILQKGAPQLQYQQQLQQYNPIQPIQYQSEPQKAAPMVEINANNGGNFFNHQTDDDRKRQDQEKKKQYAHQLQQQMVEAQQQKSQMESSDSRRRRGGSIQPHQVAQVAGQLDSIQQQKPVFDYPMMPPPQLQMQQFEQFQQQFNPSQGYMNPYMQQQQNQPVYPPQAQPGQYSIDPYQMHQQYQQPLQVQAQPQGSVSQPGSQSQDNEVALQQKQRQKQEDYRRELENQIRLKEDEKKFKAQRDKLLDQADSAPQIARANTGNNNYGVDPNQPYQKPDYAIPSQQQAPQQPSFVRQKTDVRNGNAPPSEEDQNERKSRQQQYQEELQKQVEERKRIKDEEKRKQQMEDEIVERKMQQQQHELKQKENSELMKEGRSVKEEKKRNVRRDLFEPSSDNPTAHIAAPRVTSGTESNQQSFQGQHDLNNRDNQFYSQQQEPQRQFELPIQQRREDLFGGRGGAGPSIAPSQEYSRQSYDRQAPSSLNYPSQMPLQSSQFSQGPQFPLLNSQFTQGSMPPQLGYPTDYSRQQQLPLEDEYGKMVGMYQKAFSEIIEFKNQYMEEVMNMRERVIKEREEILEYEKVKQQQQLEIQNLKAVYERLGDMLKQDGAPQMRPKQPEIQQQAYMNPLVQSNLNNLIQKQQEDILRLSQGGLPVGFSYQSLQKYTNQHMGQQNQQREQQIPTILPDQYKAKKHLLESPNVLEQSLSSDTKFVVVPQNRLATVVTQNGIGASTQLTQTWKEDQLLMPPPNYQQTGQNQQSILQMAQMQATGGTMNQSLSGSSQFITGHQQTTPQKPSSLVTTSKMIATQASVASQIARPQSSMPEPIQEMPSHQEDDQINQSRLEELKKSERMARVHTAEEENDFNSRESSKSRGGEDSHKRLHEEEHRSKHILIRHETSKNNITKITEVSSYAEQDFNLEKRPSNNVNLMMTVDSNPLGNTINDNMAMIDQILSKQTPQLNKLTLDSGALPVSIQHQQMVERTMRGAHKGSELKTIASPANSTQMQKTQQKTSERFHQAALTGSSFYNATIQMQKQQEQSQQEELQKQLMRIYGTTALSSQEIPQPSQSIQAASKPQSAKQAPQQPQIVRSEQVQQPRKQEQPDKYQQAKSYLYPAAASLTSEDDDHHLLMQSNINIADSVNEETQKNMEQLAMLNRMRLAAQQQQLLQQQQQQQMQRGEPVEVQMNERPKFSRDAPRQNPINFEDTNQTHNSQLDIWNDPDLVPPPVTTLDDDMHDDAYFPVLPHHQNSYEDQAHYGSNPIHYMVGGMSNLNTSMNAGTVNQLQMFSPPSHVDEENDKINLGTYNQEQFAHELEPTIEEEEKHASPMKRPPMSAKQPISSVKQPAPFQLNLMSHHQHHDIGLLKPNTAQTIDGDMSDRSMSKKERDIIEIAKLIQKATDTTNTLLGNTDHFKFRFKREGDEGNNKPQEIVKNVYSHNGHDESSMVEVEEDADSRILQRMDVMLNELQGQRQQAPPQYRSYTQLQEEQEAERIQIANVDGESEDSRLEEQPDPMAAFRNEAQSTQEPIKLRRDVINFTANRPVSGRQHYNQESGRNQMASIGKQSQMSNQASQRSLGKFAQMAVNNTRGMGDHEIEEMSRKYGGGSNSRGRCDQGSRGISPNDNEPKQVILRPVSGKSNSNRYSHIDAAAAVGGYHQTLGSSRSKTRSNERAGALKSTQQDMYFDEESEEEVVE